MTRKQKAVWEILHSVIFWIHYKYQTEIEQNKVYLRFTEKDHIMLQIDVDIQEISEFLVSVANRDLCNVCNFCNFPLRAPFSFF